MYTTHLAAHSHMAVQHHTNMRAHTDTHTRTHTHTHTQGHSAPHLRRKVAVPMFHEAVTVRALPQDTTAQ